ncbi:BQ5605_C011g06458 [Microbotryum silenes-dioicae]|uniref:BQ5605_C011g06458 protein n=1 Tax=Microbotryum silenes-dioicae TaxID=796604 RepID=A0A2X0NRZ0_9BASI|nr:BQ5605_C011g06458 [Microbotryum silenes-dioicae]
MLHIKSPKRYKTAIRIHDPDNPRLWRPAVKTTHTDLRYSFSASTTRRLMQQGDQEQAAARRRAAGVGPRETTPDPLAGAASGSYPDNDHDDYNDYNHIDQRDYGGDKGPGSSPGPSDCLALTSASSVQPTLDTSHQQLDLCHGIQHLSLVQILLDWTPPSPEASASSSGSPKLCPEYLAGDHELKIVPLGSNKAMEVILIDFSAHKKVSFVPSNKGAISDLLAAGYMPATPVAPRYAFFIPFIKIHMAYHYVAKATPYAGANLLEANHRTRMSAHLSKRFSDALAAFRLFIQEEPPLEYTAQIAIDGNASQKRLKTRYSKLGQHIHPDKHTFPSKLFIPPEIVDESEVIATRKGKGRPNAANRWKSASAQAIASLEAISLLAEQFTSDYFLPTVYSSGTVDWATEMIPYCMRSLKEDDIVKLEEVKTDSGLGFDELYTRVLGAAVLTFTALSTFPPVDAIAVLPTRELTGGTRNARSLSGLHCVVDVSLPASMAAFTTCRDRCVPHSQDYLPADEVADREFHLAGRSQLLAARYETLDVARLE